MQPLSGTFTFLLARVFYFLQYRISVDLMLIPLLTRGSSIWYTFHIMVQSMLDLMVDDDEDQLARHIPDAF